MRSSPAPAGAEGLATRRRGILVVEDERNAALELQRTLEALGYDVPGNVASGEAAITWTESAAPDLVLVNVRLAGGMDGIEAATRIRARAPVPVVFLSALADAETLARAKAAEPAAYLLTPVRREDLHGAIEMALQQGARESALRRRATELEAARRTLQAYTQILEARALGSEERYRVIMDQANVAIFLCGTDGRVTEVNRHTEELFGRPAAALAGRSWDELVTPAHARVARRRLRQVLAGGVTAAQEVPIERPDGATRWVDFNASRVELPVGPAILVIARDMTDRRRARDALRRSEERFRTLVSSMEEVVFTLDRELRVDGLYGRYQARTGVPAADILGKTAQDLWGPELGAVHLEAARRALAGERWEYAWSMEGPDGAIQFETIVAPMALGEGAAITGVVGISRDVTDKQKLQAQVITSDRMASIGMLAAGVAHEINNPLAAVVTNVELALQEADALARTQPWGVQLENIREELADAKGASMRVRDIVRDLRIFARKDSERPLRVDVVQVMESTLRMAWNEVRHRARLQRDYRGVPAVIGTDSRLGQVLLNLIVNAAQAIPEGKAEDNEIRVATRHEGERVVIEIADTGPGLPAEVERRLFEPFITTKPAGIGTGLGLSICHRIVTDMGGTIAATTAPGKGTTFRIELPAAGSEEVVARAVAEVPAPVPTGRRGRVLVIDDEPAIGRAVRRLLANEHDVVTVTGGREGLRRIAAGERFDVILCDVMMPDVMGVEVHAALAKSAPEQAAKLVFLTGGVFAPDALTYIHESGVPRLEKPFEPQKLRAFVAERLRG